jgi:hypothetical protein
MRFDDNRRVPTTTDGVAWSTDVDTLFVNPPPGTEGERVVPDFTDQDFVVWMRSAALPNFNKLYRIVTVDLPKGIYRMEITNSMLHEQHTIAQHNTVYSTLVSTYSVSENTAAVLMNSHNTLLSLSVSLCLSLSLIV